MSDRRLYINERIQTTDVIECGLTVLGMDIEVLQHCGQQLRGFNPAASPLAEDEAIRRVFHKEAIPADLKDQWKKREAELNLVLNEAGIQTYPEMLWQALYRRVPHARELPTVEAALQFLQQTQRRMEYLYNPRSRDQFWSLQWGRMVAMENIGMRGAVYGSTFFRPATPLTFGNN